MKPLEIYNTLTGSEEFKRLIAELHLNNEIIGHIEKENPDFPVTAYLYENKDIPKKILEKAFLRAKERLLEFYNEKDDTTLKILPWKDQ